MLIIEWPIVGRVRFHESHHQNERIVLMFFDEFACALLQELWPRQFERQVADRQFRESPILFVRRDPAREQKISIIAVIVSRNPFVKTSPSRSFLTQMPLTDVGSAIIPVFH